MVKILTTKKNGLIQISNEFEPLDRDNSILGLSYPSLEGWWFFHARKCVGLTYTFWRRVHSISKMSLFSHVHNF